MKINLAKILPYLHLTGCKCDLCRAYFELSPSIKASATSFEYTYRTWHTWMSYIKSAIRILASILAIIFASNSYIAIMIFAIGYLIAEIVGILEELV